MTDQPLEIQKTVAGVRFHRVGKLYHFEYNEYPDLKVGDYVIVETARGRQMGEVMNFNALDEANRDYKPIMRMASPRDLILKHHWELQQDIVIESCRQKAKEMGGFGDVKFIAAVYNYDGSLLTFLYTADDKVNVSKLWNELTRMFPAQVDMRQIGPRDVAKLLGGYGACGELRCCSTFLTDFSPISIKMAKAQGISLNPSEITGMCGRLRCCLVYEYEQYVEARQKLPKKNKRIGTPFGEAKVVDVLPLQDAVLVYIEEHGLQVIKREEIVPLEELEALAKKAKEPCTVHGDEGCDCGAKPPKAKAETVTAAAPDTDIEPQTDVDTATGETDAHTHAVSRSDQSPSGQSHRPRQRKRGDKRDQPKPAQNAQNAQTVQSAQSDTSQPATERKDRPPRQDQAPKPEGRRKNKQRQDRRPPKAPDKPETSE